MMKSTRRLKLGAILFILVALFVVVNLTGFSKNIRGFFYSFSSPVQQNLWSAGACVSDFFEGVFKKSALTAENEDLKLQNNELLLKVASLSDLEKENEDLRTALNVGLNREFRLFLIQIVGKDVGKDIILMDKGAKDGLSLGMPVITAQKVLVGKITEIYNSYSKVTLITAPEISFGVTIGDNILGEAKGEGGQLLLDMVPKDKEIKEGDIVISTSLGGIFPGGLLVGEVKNIKKSDTESFQKAEIQPAIDTGELNNLFVIVD